MPQIRVVTNSPEGVPVLEMEVKAERVDESILFALRTIVVMTMKGDANRMTRAMAGCLARMIFGELAEFPLYSADTSFTIDVFVDGESVRTETGTHDELFERFAPQEE